MIFNSIVKRRFTAYFKRKYVIIPLMFAWIFFESELNGSCATHTVTFSVSSICELSVSGDPPPLVIDQAVAGCNPRPVVDDSTFYALTSNGESENIWVSVCPEMPQGTALSVILQPPNGATSLGYINLDVYNQKAVSGISRSVQSNMQITYLFEASIRLGILPPTNRLVIYTISP